jgi:hypothetical protein
VSGYLVSFKNITNQPINTYISTYTVGVGYITFIGKLAEQSQAL